MENCSGGEQIFLCELFDLNFFYVNAILLVKIQLQLFFLCEIIWGGIYVTQSMLFLHSNLT